MRYVTVDESTGMIINASEWDGKTEWAPPEGCRAYPSEIAGIGWEWNDGEPRDPNPPPPLLEVKQLTIEEKLRMVGIDPAELKKFLGVS